MTPRVRAGASPGVQRGVGDGAASRAYGNARVRAMRSRLLGPGDARVLRGASGVRAIAELLAARGHGVSDPAALQRALLTELGNDYAKMARIYPDAADVWTALLGLHEAANIALSMRAQARGVPEGVWRPLWRPVGGLDPERLDASDWSRVVSTARRAHGDDLAAVELALDRSARRRIVDVARERPAVRELLEDYVRSRDLDLLRRAGAHGLSPEVAVAATSGLDRREVLLPLARWSVDEGPLGRVLPRSWRLGKGLADWPALDRALRERRRAACRRAFAHPFTLAPPVALLLLREAEIEGLVALLEAGGDPALDDAVTGALLAGAMGAS